MTVRSFVPPPYPYDRLKDITSLAETHEGGAVDCSIGDPCDRAPAAAMAALASSHDEHRYPASAGSATLIGAATGWMNRRFGLELDTAATSACVGTKEFVASTAQYMKLRRPDRDTVLYPSVSYPTYAMGATLAGLRAVPVPPGEGTPIDLNAIAASDLERAVMLWVNTPGNPTGELTDLESVAEFGRRHDIAVFSDECYVEFTWAGPARTIVESGLGGVIALHSLSKRSNFAGMRVGIFAGDPELVDYLREVRRHGGLMIPGPVQAAAAVAFDDDVHVEIQRQRYCERLDVLALALEKAGCEVPRPAGAFYLWVPVPASCADAWVFAAELARHGGLVVSPGELYGPHGARFVRVAAVQPLERLALFAQRLAQSGHSFR